jgi:hypothetical protein
VVQGCDATTVDGSYYCLHHKKYHIRVVKT